MSSIYWYACSMRTYLNWAAFGLRGRFRKNNKLFHEQRMMPGFLWTSCPHTPTHPTPALLIPAPFHALLPPPLGTRQRKQGLAEAWYLSATGPAGVWGLTWGHGCEDPAAASSAEELTWIRLSHTSKIHNLEQELKIPKDNSTSAKFSEIWLKFVSRFQVIQEE